MKEIIEQYNNQNTILIISSYPDKKEGIKNLNAVAWYCQKTLHQISKIKKQNFVVLAEKINEDNSRMGSVKNGRILVVRCWQRNSPFLFKDLICWLAKFNQIKTVNIQFEFSMFGGLLTTVFLLPFLLATKLLRKKIVLTLHHVVLDLNTLSGHLNLEKGSLFSRFFNFLLSAFYKIAGSSADKIIVLDRELEKRLTRYVAGEKISTVPIGIEENPKFINKQEARKRLGLAKKDFVILFFGFLTWYKGIDWLVKQRFGQKIKLIVAGGKSPTLKTKPHYQRFYKNVSQLAEKSENIFLTGFVPEEDIRIYFSACDLVILPYRTMISSSGPLSWALTFKKPFLLSKALENYFHSQDFLQSLKETGLKKSDLLFSLRRNSLRKKIYGLNNVKLARLAKFSSILAQKRGGRFLASLYYHQLTGEVEKTPQLDQEPVTEPVYA